MLAFESVIFCLCRRGSYVLAFESIIFCSCQGSYVLAFESTIFCFCRQGSYVLAFESNLLTPSRRWICYLIYFFGVLCDTVADSRSLEWRKPKPCFLLFIICDVTFICDSHCREKLASHQCLWSFSDSHTTKLYSPLFITCFMIIYECFEKVPFR